MIMTTAALLAKNSAPTDSDIDEALGGHICRCGTYLRIRRAVHQAAAKHSASEATAPLPAPAGAGGAR
jgi:isoquinoline 1-oxidoreductase alpha subunit